MRGLRKLSGLLAIVVMTAGLMLPMAAPLVRGTDTTTRPISDWTNAQGTSHTFGSCFQIVFEKKKFCIPTFITWVELATNRVGIVDYAGLENAFLQTESHGKISLGTAVSGTVTERPLADGRAEIRVLLQTTNALTDVESFNPAVLSPSPLQTQLFGHPVWEVLQGKDAALGSSTFEVVFINTAPGAPLPDILDVIFGPAPGQELVYLVFSGTAFGTLRAAFGVPDGTPGLAHVIQTGLLMTAFKGATADAFPVENVNLFVTGN